MELHWGSERKADALFLRAGLLLQTSSLQTREAGLRFFAGA